MIKTEKLNKSIEAIHDLLIKIKLMTINNKPNIEIYNFTDDIEYLPQLIFDDVDRTELFEQELEKICEKYNFPLIIEKYRNKK